MIGAVDIGQYLRILDLIDDTVGYDEVVDAPSGVVLAGVEAVAPPRIHALGVGVEAAPCVGEARFQNSSHLAAFFIGESGVLAVGLGIFEVDLLMRDVQIAAVDDRLLLVKSLDVGEEVVLPAHAVVEALEAVLTVRGVDGDEVEVVILERDDPALVIVLVDADAIADRERSVLCKYRGAGVSLLLGVVPVALVAFEAQVDLTLLQFCLLQAEKVGAYLIKNICEALAHDSTQTVDVP